MGLGSKTVPRYADLPMGKVAIVPITLLYSDELKFAAQGEQARDRLAKLFAKKYDEPISSTNRVPIIPIA